MSGLAYLQQEAVVHCDLDLGNIGFKIPRIEQYTEDDLLGWMDNPILIAIVPRDHSVQNDSLPKYLVLATS
ncbi:hypothetical protein M405DRAFT_900999, partial [Rhizopogon salebrosus TDB-379]